MTSTISPMGAPPVLDMQAALSRIDDDHELYREIVEIFLDDTPAQLTVLETSIAENDRIVAERQAHSLKSASANIGGEALRQAAGRMERVASTATDSEMREMLGQLQQEFARLRQALKAPA